MKHGKKIRQGSKTALSRLGSAVAAYAEVLQQERERNEKIEEMVLQLMEDYTGDRLVLVDKED